MYVCYKIKINKKSGIMPPNLTFKKNFVLKRESQDGSNFFQIFFLFSVNGILPTPHRCG
jgi:hypothetical protein